MSFVTSFQVSASGLEAQRLRMDLASMNLANAQTTHGPDGKVYQKVKPVFETRPLEFGNALEKEMGIELQAVAVSSIQKDTTPPRRSYDPGHPDADKDGFVSLPNVNLMEEMADMMLASRAYEANVTAFNTTKGIALKALELGKSG